MSPRERPDDCCSPPLAPARLAPAERRRLLATLRALGDPTRLDIFCLIAGQPGPVCVCDVVDRFAVSQPAISHHLKVLREAGLVSVSRRGVWAYYAATSRGLEVLRSVRSALGPADQLAAG